MVEPAAERTDGKTQQKVTIRKDVQGRIEDQVLTEEMD